MTQESVASKLSKLFDLYISDAITKDEYDLLKSQLLGKKEINIEYQKKDSSEIQETNIDNIDSIQPQTNKTNKDKQKDKQLLLYSIIVAIVSAMVSYFLFTDYEFVVFIVLFFASRFVIMLLMGYFKRDRNDVLNENSINTEINENIEYQIKSEVTKSVKVKSNKKRKIPYINLLLLFVSIGFIYTIIQNGQSHKSELKDSQLHKREQKEDSLRMAKYKEQLRIVAANNDSIDRVVSKNIELRKRLQDSLDAHKVIDVLKEKFLNGENQEPYSAYSKHKFNLDLNAPKVDKVRGLEPKDIADGIQRAYFENSDNVCIQRTLSNGDVIEEIQYHPDGRIYSITNLVNGKKQGKIKYVDLDNIIILEGEFDQGNFVGMWNSPILGHFNPNSDVIREQYPGIINQIKTLMHFYDYTKDERNFYMN